MQWLRDNLKMIKAAPEVEELAMTVEDNGGVYFVPAFSGLFAPYWRSDARGVIAGLTRYVNAGHIARAVLEATAYQTREVVDAMNADSGVALESLKVDGGMVHNELLMQFQADLLDVPVIRPAWPRRRRSGRPTPRGWRSASGGAGGPPRELGRGQALDAVDGRQAARDRLPVLEEGGHPHVRLGGGGGIAAAPIECDVLVIGGGATGLGVVRDVAMRGFRTVLVERVDLGQGTTGRFHGLLHSGGRYVTSDPRSATECAEENATLKRIAAEAIEDTGGLFVTTPADDPDYADRFLAGCHAAAGVPVQEIPPRRWRASPGSTRASRAPSRWPTPRSTPGSCCGATRARPSRTGRAS